MTDTVYHYTNQPSMIAIKNAGLIKQSSGELAQFGPGVYATKMNPYQFCKAQLAQNNYDGIDATFISMLKRGNLDYAFKLKVPKGRFNRVVSGRNIWKHDGNLFLNECIEWEIIHVEH